MIQRKCVVVKVGRNHISRNTLHFIENEADRVASCGMDKSKCGCLVLVTYKCTCTIAKKMKHKYTHSFG